MTTQQLTTAIISLIKKATTEETGGSDVTPNTSNNASNVFGGREGAKRSKTD